MSRSHDYQLRVNASKVWTVLVLIPLRRCTLSSHARAGTSETSNGQTTMTRWLLGQGRQNLGLEVKAVEFRS